MSLATRCPACGTVFRVVPDQLKVSDGWVRCGRCHEVFDASRALVDLDARGPVVVPTPSIAPGRDRVQAHAPAAAANDETPPGASDATPASPAAPETATATDRTSLPPAEAVPASAQVPPLPSSDEGPAAPAAAAGDVAPEPPPEALPDFMLRAQRADRWRSPARRAMLALTAVALLVVFAGQVALHYRDLLAASWPPARPALVSACAWIGCRIEAPRRIDSLSVESSALLRIEGTALHRLQVVVRNRAATAARMPAVDLTLTDTLGQPVARRVFEAAELGVAAGSLAPQAEATMTATLDLADVPVTGYAVELFYP